MGQAYDILYDDEKRHLYDTQGMSAFDPRRGGMGGSPVDLDEVLQAMFGMSGSGMPPGFGGGSGPRKPRQGRDEEQNYQVTLEELYRGKTTKFASTKNVICSHCKGTGGKENAKPKQCSSCQGRGKDVLFLPNGTHRSNWTWVGSRMGLRPVGAGLVTQEQVICDACKGSGSVYKDKERCKKCKGACVTEAKKVLELSIPPGSKYV